MKKKEILICESCYFPTEVFKESPYGNICDDCFQDYEQKKAKISKINHKVYLGSKEAASDLKLLKSLGVTHILVCGKELDKNFTEDFAYMKIALNDDPFEDLKKFIDPAVKFIIEGRKVLVHCKAGISRSPSIVIAYLMRYYDMTFEEALIDVKSKRESVSPNYGFQMQLKEYEETLKKKDYLMI